MEIIREKEYDTVMKEMVEPYLKKHGKSGYISSYDGIGKIHVMRYLTENPKGVIVICHGYTESASKYDELVYYFLQAGYQKETSGFTLKSVCTFYGRCDRRHCSCMEAGVVLSGNIKFTDDPSTYGKYSMGDFSICGRSAVFTWKR